MEIPQLQHLELPQKVESTYPQSIQELSAYDDYIKTLSQSGYNDKEIKTMRATLQAMQTYHSEALASYIHLDPTCIYDPNEDDPIICRIHTQQIIDHAQKHLQLWEEALNDSKLKNHPNYTEMRQSYNQLSKGINHEIGEVLKVIPAKGKIDSLLRKIQSSSIESTPSPSETLTELKRKQASLQKSLRKISLEQELVQGQIDESSAKLSKNKTQKQKLQTKREDVDSVMQSVQNEIANLNGQIDRAQSQDEIAVLDKQLASLKAKLTLLGDEYSQLHSAEQYLGKSIHWQEMVQMMDAGQLSSLNASLELEKDSLIDVLTDITTIISVRLLLIKERQQLKNEISKQMQQEKQSEVSLGDANIQPC